MHQDLSAAPFFRLPLGSRCTTAFKSGGAGGPSVVTAKCSGCTAAHSCDAPPPAWMPLLSIQKRALRETASYFIVAGYGPSTAESVAFHGFCSAVYEPLVEPRELAAAKTKMLMKGARAVTVVPTRYLVDAEMTAQCGRLKQKLIADLAVALGPRSGNKFGPRYYALLCDKWSSYCKRGWLGVSIQYLRDDGVLHTECLGIVYVTEGSAGPTRSVLLGLLGEFGLNFDNCIPCTDAGEPMPAVFKGTSCEKLWTRCSNHIL